MEEEKLRQLYRDEGWGQLAEAAGYDPVHTEISARAAFRFSYDVIADKDATIRRLHETLAAVRDAGAVDPNTPLGGRVYAALPGTI